MEGAGTMAETSDERRVRVSDAVMQAQLAAKTGEAPGDADAAAENLDFSKKGGVQTMAEQGNMPGWLKQRDVGEQPTLDVVLDAQFKRDDVLMRFVRPDEGFVWPFMRGSGRWGHGGWSVGRGKVRRA